MTHILVDSDCLPAADLAACIAAANRALGKWAPAWGIVPLITSDATLPFNRVAHITDLHRHTSALGYHTVEAGIQLYHADGTHTVVPAPEGLPVGGEPTSYISPSALLHNIYGTYTAPHWSVALWNLARTKITRAAKQTSPARYREGIVTVLVHELMEMLADSYIDTVSSPDSTGAAWLIEVADHVSGTYYLDTTDPLHPCIISGATFPSYYSLKGIKPFDTCEFCTTPFDTTSPTFYGYIKSAAGALIKIVKGSIHH